MTRPIASVIAIKDAKRGGGRRRGRKIIERRMVHVEDGTRNDLSPGVIIWVDVGGGGVFHYTLRKFICVDGAHFSTGRPRTWASQILHSIPPDNGVTLHSFRARRPGLFFFFSSGAIRSCRACPTASPSWSPSLLCRGKSTGQEWSVTKHRRNNVALLFLNE